MTVLYCTETCSCVAVKGMVVLDRKSVYLSILRKFWLVAKDPAVGVG